MPTYTNNSNIPLSIAAWLSHDSYDHDPDPNHISVTGLLQSTRQIILSRRMPDSDRQVDIASLVPSRMGTAIHDHIESIWVNHHKDCLLQLGYPKGLVNRIRVNPSPDELTPDTVPVYLEQRSEKTVEGFRVSGKFDFVGDGRVEDVKTTSTFTFVNKTNDDKYVMQGSLYRWLNPEIITRDEMAIQFIFTDWSAMRARSEKDKGYPQSRTHEYRLPLKSFAETDAWVTRKLREVKQYMDAPEADLPLCTDEQLWRSPPVYKYYKNPDKMTRSTKNFTNLHEANLRLAQDGGTGIVVEHSGKVGACRYCDAFELCKQKDRYLEDGSLEL